MFKYVSVWLATALTAAATGTAVDPSSFLTPFLQYGAVGSVAAAGLWFAYRNNKRTEERADRLETQLSALHQEIRDKIIPALTASTQTNAEVAQVLRDLLLRGRGPQ